MMSWYIISSVGMIKATYTLCIVLMISYGEVYSQLGLNRVPHYHQKLEFEVIPASSHPRLVEARPLGCVVCGVASMCRMRGNEATPEDIGIFPPTRRVK